MDQQYSFGAASGTVHSPGGMSKYFDKCYGPEMLEYLHCNLVVDKVTSNHFLKTLVACGMEYRYYTSGLPQVFSNRKANEFLESSQPTMCERRITFKRRAHVNEKYDMDTLSRMCQSAAFLTDRRQKVALALSIHMNSEFLKWAMVNAHRCNQGENGGVNGTINFGTETEPVVINGINLIAWMRMWQSVFNGYHYPASGRWAITHPDVFNLIGISHAASNALTGTGALEINGMCDFRTAQQLGCSTAHFTNCIEPRRNPNNPNQVIYPIIFGWMPAIEFASGMEKISGEYSAMPFYAGKHLIESVVFDFALIRDEALALAWVTIDPDAMNKLPGACCP